MAGADDDEMGGDDAKGEECERGYKREKEKLSSNFGDGMIMGATSPKQKRQ